MFKSTRATIMFILITIITAIFTYVGVKASLTHPVPPFAKPETEVVNQTTGGKVTQDTIISQRIIYSQCADEQTFKVKAPDNVIGFTLSELQKVYHGWIIDKFNSQDIYMHMVVDGLCPEHAKHMFIGVKDGWVAVYYGKPGGKVILREITGIPLKSLIQRDVQELERGVVVESREEMLQTLEGLQSK